MGWIVIIGVAGCGSRALPGDQDGAVAADGPAKPRDARTDGLVRPSDGARPDAARPRKERVAEACAFAAACSGWHMQPPVTASQCVEWFAYRDWPRGGYAGLGPSMLDRLATCAPAADCKAFSSCYGGSWFGPTACREGGECSKDMLWTQQNSALFLHCDALGGVCWDLPTGAIRACCVDTICGGTQTTCHPDPNGSSKTGTACMLGMAYDFDCSTMGQFCSTVPNQLCVGPGASCDPNTTKVSCTGSVAKYCVARTEGGGNIANVDCASTVFHSACNAGATSYDPCRPAGNECTASYKGECQGKSLMVCVDGYKLAVDCEAIGFDLCGTPPPDSTPRCMYAL